ncbi:MAG: hypothetical protein RLZZ628_276 [Bacteroidota bacterium]|jgi:hypothetical protein
MNKSSVIRTAAILYADDNQNTTQKTIQRKVVECIFVDFDNSELSVPQIIERIQSQLDLVFDQIEVTKIINGAKKGVFEVRYDPNLKLDLIRLENARYQTLKTRESNNTIKNHISEYVETVYKDAISTSKEHIEETIYKFLYELLNKNIAAFKKITSSKFKAEDISINANVFEAQEREAINGFLNWDNPSKNKAVFTLISYAIEYSLISNNVDGSTTFLKSLKNKVFYLDSNVIFRAIGIDGEEPKKQIKTFIQRCKDSGQIFILSRYTLEEFKSTTKYYVNQLQKIPCNKINPHIFKKYAHASIYEFYHSWRASRNTAYGFDQFSAYIAMQFDSLRKEFAIQEDYRVPFDEEDKMARKIIDKYTIEIANSKGTNTNRNSYDAKNTYWVEKKRGDSAKNIIDTKYFFVSIDQKLRNWDFQRNENQPIALLPNQWMSIVLKYFARTEDDFKSFVSFLKLNQDDSVIEEENLQIILAGISEITEDFNKQAAIFDKMLEVKFDRIIENKNKDELRQKASEFAKSIMDTEIAQLEDNHKAAITEYQAKLLITASKEQESISISIESTEKLITAINQSLLDLEASRKPLDMLAVKQTTQHLWFYGGIVAFFHIILIVLIAILGWDTMEKYTYIFGLSDIAFSPIYFLANGKSFNLDNYRDKILASKKELVYRTYNFNFNRVSQIQADKIELENKLQTLKAKL